jgi:1-acyl-sn-glycerol-3-phosphate acyltransferase
MRFRWRVGWYLIYPIARFFVGFRTEGREYLSRLKNFVLAANHTANIDPIVLGLAAKRELHYLAKAELFRANKFFAWLIRAYNAVPLQREVVDFTAIRQMRGLLKRNRSVVVFPEGSRSRSGDFQPFKPGIGLLAINERVPAVPAYIYGLKDSYISYTIDRDIRRPSPEERKAGSWIAFLRGKRRIGVRFGPPIYPNGFQNNRRDYERYTEAINQSIQNLGNNLTNFREFKNKNKED